MAGGYSVVISLAGWLVEQPIRRVIPDGSVGIVQLFDRATSQPAQGLPSCSLVIMAGSGPGCGELPGLVMGTPVSVVPLALGSNIPMFTSLVDAGGKEGRCWIRELSFIEALVMMKMRPLSLLESLSQETYSETVVML